MGPRGLKQGFCWAAAGLSVRVAVAEFLGCLCDDSEPPDLMGFAFPNTSSFSAPALGPGLCMLCSPSSPGECWGQPLSFPSLMSFGLKRQGAEQPGACSSCPAREGAALRGRTGTGRGQGPFWSCLVTTTLSHGHQEADPGLCRGYALDSVSPSTGRRGCRYVLPACTGQVLISSSVFFQSCC